MHLISPRPTPARNTALKQNQTPARAAGVPTRPQSPRRPPPLRVPSPGPAHWLSRWLRLGAPRKTIISAGPESGCRAPEALRLLGELTRPTSFALGGRRVSTLCGEEELGGCSEYRCGILGGLRARPGKVPVETPCFETPAALRKEGERGTRQAPRAASTRLALRGKLSPQPAARLQG